MAKPKFVSGANELQFSVGLIYPVPKPHEKLQVIDRTAAGSLQVEDLGIDIRTRRLAFENMPQTDYDALMNFYDTECDGAMNTFTYHDEDGNTFTVQLMTNPIDFQETSHQRYSGELLLEVVS